MGRQALDADSPGVLPSVGQLDANELNRTYGRLDFICPLDQHNGLRIAEIIEAEHLKLGDGVETIGVYMIDVESAHVLIDDDECRAGDASKVLGACAGSDTFDEMRLAAAEWAADAENLAAFELSAQRASEFKRLPR